MNRALPIGVFDSGVGGLTVLKELVGLMPHEDFIYFGDTLRAPYGSKSKKTILRYAKEVSSFLTEKGVKVIVTACNTESAYALEDMRKNLSCHVLGVIEPGAMTAIRTTKYGKIGVIATEATIRSKAYYNQLKLYDESVDIFTKACPKLVPLIEANNLGSNLQEVLKDYLSYFDDKNIDTLVLGCTHYPLIAEPILNYFGGKIRLVNPAISTAVALKELLIAENLDNKSQELGKHIYYASKSSVFMKKLSLDISPNSVIEIYDKFNK